MTNQRPANRYPLLLSAGELIRKMMKSVRDSKGFCQLPQLLFIHARPVKQQRQCDILFHIQYRNQIIELIDQPDLPAPENRQLRFIQTVNVCSVNHYLSRSRKINAANQMKQR